MCLCWFICSIKKISYHSFFWKYFIWSNFICAFIFLNMQNAWNTILGSFSSFNCFLTISYFSFVTELVWSCSKFVSKESLSSGISHTLATLKYSIPFSFIVLRKVRCLFLYVNSCFEFDKSRTIFNLSGYLCSVFVKYWYFSS